MIHGSSRAAYFLLTVLVALGSSDTSLSQTLVADWPFSGNASDATGNGHNGTVNGAQLCSDRFGNANQAFSFDGNDWISVPHATPLAFGPTSDFTVNAWIKCCSTMTEYAGVVCKGPTNVYFPGYQMLIRSSRYLSGEVGIPPNSGVLMSGTTSVNDGRWHMLTYVVSTSGGVFELFVDGVSVARVTSNSMDPTGTYSNDLFIGRERNSTGYFIGAIDDVRIYNSALGTSGIQTLYTQGSWPLPPNVPSVSVEARALDPTTICSGDSVRLSGSGDADSYRWEPATGLSYPNTPTPTARPATTTVYRYIGTKSAPTPAPCGSSIVVFDTASITITVNSGPVVFLNRSVFICAGSSMRIGSPAQQGIPPYSYSWTPTNDLDDPTVAMPTVTPTASRTYRVKITDAGGCITTDSVRVQLLPPPGLSLSDTSICRGGAPVRIGREATGANPPFSYMWSPPAGLDNDRVAQPNAAPDTTTTYTVVVTDAAGCSKSVSMTVRVHPPVIPSGGIDRTICIGDTVRLGAPRMPGRLYVWSPEYNISDAALSDPLVWPRRATTFYVTVTDTSTGCSGTDSVTVRVRSDSIRYSPDSLDFGDLGACASYRERTIVVRNPGAEVVSLEEAETAGGDFTIVAFHSAEIRPGDSVTLVIRFSPRAAGPHRDTIVFRTGPCGGEWRIPVKGGKLRMLASVRPAVIDWGPRWICGAVTLDTTFDITNDGDDPMVVSSGSVAPPFFVVSPALPQTVAPRSTLTLTASFRPAASGSYSGDLRLEVRSGECIDTLVVPLSGVLAEPELTPAPSVLTFSLMGCSDVGDTIIVLRNPTPLPISVDSATASMGFSIVGFSRALVGAGDTIILRVRYLPSGAGTTRGRAIVWFSPCTDSLLIDLTGTKTGVTFETADTLRFGPLVSCRSRDTMLISQVTLRSDDAVSGSIEAVSVSGPFRTSLTPGTMLTPGIPATFSVTFVPTQSGSFEGALDVVLQPCGTRRRIALVGSLTNASLSFSGALDFGIPNTTDPVRLTAVLRNTGGVPVQVDSVIAATPFRVVNTTPPLAAILQLDDSLSVEVEYLPRASRDTMELVAYASSPCQISTSTPLYAGTDDRARCVVRVPRLSAAPGAVIDIPLYLDSAVGLDRVGAHEFVAVISFDRSLLVPLDPHGVSESGSIRSVTLEGTRDGADAILARIPARAALGRAPSTPVTIDSFAWRGTIGPIIVTRIPGEFVLDSICREGGERLFDAGLGVVLRPIRPNPARATVVVEYQSFEDGRVLIELYDCIGKLAMRLIEPESPSGDRKREIDLSNVSAGSYLLVLRTGSIVRTQCVEVMP